MTVFYTPDVSQTDQLPREEALHCTRVLRLKPGDQIKLCDGLGNFYTAELLQSDNQCCRYKVLETEKQTLPWRNSIEIALAPTKNQERVEWFAEKATEIGIDTISFLRCRHSERKEMKTSRLEKIVVSAMKQSMKATLPNLKEIVDFQDYVQKCSFTQKFIAHCYPEDKKSLSHCYDPSQDAVVLIGPEGDFSESEVQMALQCGFRPISLGESRLRTETAALVACHTMHLINELTNKTD